MPLPALLKEAVTPLMVCVPDATRSVSADVTLTTIVPPTIAMLPSVGVVELNENVGPVVSSLLSTDSVVKSSKKFPDASVKDPVALA